MEETKENECPVTMDHILDSSETRITMSSHAEKMAALEYNMPEPSRRPKTLWDELREEFACDPLIQHCVWAARVKRMFQKDCGFNPDLNCDCDK